MPGESFFNFVMDLLAELPDLRSRAMFGGHGLYQGEVFFGIVYKGRLYFKTNQDTRLKFEAEGMEPFKPSNKQTLKNYYEVPPDLLEDGERLIEWAREAEKV